ncbi:MAG: OmpA family protein [Deltaproteobacteria bacterium]|nr:OmpA family protein [Deltaproteobacteria bacterium]
MPKPGRESEPKFPTHGRSGGGGGRTLLFAAVALLAGAIGGFFGGPRFMPDPRIDEAVTRVAAADGELKRSKDTATKLEADITQLTADKQAIETRLADAEKIKETLASKSAEAQKKAKEAEAVEKKLKAALDRNGTITTEGEQIRISITDKVLFKPNDDALTATGTKVLDKLAGALKDLASKQILVEGHTDDQPPPKPTAPKPPPPPKKGAKPVAAAVVAPVETFATNWELASARALAVVHYLQDIHKIDPTRLGALALGQYRPVSKTNKAANRRIEIVLSPKPKK